MKLELVAFSALLLGVLNIETPVVITPESSSAIWFGEVEISPLEHKHTVTEDSVMLDKLSGFMGKPIREQPKSFSPLEKEVQIVLADSPGLGPPQQDAYPRQGSSKISLSDVDR